MVPLRWVQQDLMLEYRYNTSKNINKIQWNQPEVYQSGNKQKWSSQIMEKNKHKVHAKKKGINWGQCLWGPGGQKEVDIALFASNLILRQGWSPNGQILALSLRVSWQIQRALSVFLNSGAILLLVVKTKGLNEDFSMSITLWLYLSFSFSCCR